MRMRLGAPPLSINETYLQALLDEWATRTECIKMSKDIRDPRPAMLAKNLITMVANAKVQEQLWELRDEYYKAALAAYKNPSRDDEARARFDADTLALGHLWNWIGGAIPLITQMTFGVCGPLEGEDYDEQRFGRGTRGGKQAGAGEEEEDEDEDEDEDEGGDGDDLDIEICAE